MVSGELSQSHELEVNVGASQVWELYSSLRLAQLVEEQLSSVIQKINVVEGDGGVGTVLHLFFVPGAAGFSDYKEKFTKVDHEKRVKEAEVIEGGYLEFGFKYVRARFEIIEKDERSSIIKSHFRIPSQRRLCCQCLTRLYRHPRRCLTSCPEPSHAQPQPNF